MGFYGLGVEVEVLGIDGWRKGADGLAGRSPESGHHVDGEGYGAESCHDAGHGHGLVYLAAHSVFLELQLADEVEAHGSEDDYPQREEHLAFEQMPAVGQVGDGEELQREGEFDKSQHDLDGGHPRARPRCRLEPRGEQGKECEGQSQCQGEAQHAYGGCQPVAGGDGLYQQQTYDGRGAGA